MSKAYWTPTINLRGHGVY